MSYAKGRTGHAWPELDGVRAFAVLGVMAFHGGVDQLQGGFYGVDVFFVLSGFLITTVLLREWDSSDRISLRHFYLRRAFRLWPALGLISIAALAYSFTIGPGWIRQTTITGLPWVWGFVGNWAMALHAPGGNLGFLGHTWSLAVEEQFYWLWPLVLVATLRRGSNRNKVAFGMLVAAFIMANWRMICVAYSISPNTIYFRTGTHSDGLLLGCALALWLNGSSQARRGPRFPWLVLLAGAVPIVVEYVRPSMPVLPEGATFEVSLATAGVLWVLVTRPPGAARTILGWRPARYIGRISYGLYLWHFPIYVAFQQVPWLVAHPNIDWLLKWTVPFAVSALSFELVERRFLEMGRHRGHPSSTRTPAAVAA